LNDFIKLSPYVQVHKDVRVFADNLNIKELNQAEKRIVNALIARSKEKEIAELSDVHGFHLKHNHTYFCEEGLVVEKKDEGETVKEVLKPQPWLVPEGMVKSYPGIQQAAAFAVTCVKRTEDGLKNYVGQTETEFYRLAKFTGIDHTGMSYFGDSAIKFLEQFFAAQTNKGSGRKFIEQMLLALSSMDQATYLSVHFFLNLGPLQDCFEWGYPSSNGGYIKVQKVSDRQDLVILRVKDQFLPYFTNAASAKAMDELRKHRKFGTVFPVLSKPIPFSYKAPTLDSIAKCSSFVAACRTQRQSDEKGLSALSCGVGASGNPTKQQLRQQKILTICLGILRTFDEEAGRRLVIVNSKSSEIEYLHHQLQEWDEMAKVIGNREYVFRVQPGDNVQMRLDPEYTITTTSPQEGDVIFDCSPSAPLTMKKDSQAFTDSQSEKLMQALIPYDLQECIEHNVHYVTMKHIQSELLFVNRKETEPIDGYYISSLGSIHNMYCVVSTMPEVPVFVCNGTSEWSYELGTTDPILTPTDFYRKVKEDNMKRSGFFLSAGYSFNPKLNVLRHMHGKTVDFETGNVEALAVDVGDLSSIGALEVENMEAEEEEIALEKPKKVRVSNSSNSSSKTPNAEASEELKKSSKNVKKAPVVVEEQQSFEGLENGDWT
jgi:hypothetical protein